MFAEDLNWLFVCQVKNLVSVQVLDRYQSQFDCHIHDQYHHSMKVLMKIEVIEFEFEAMNEVFPIDRDVRKGFYL